MLFRSDVRKLVNKLRRRGVPIASSRDGYFYAKSAGEIYGTIRQLHGMVKGLEAAIAGLEDAMFAFSQEQSRGDDL